MGRAKRKPRFQISLAFTSQTAQKVAHHVSIHLSSNRRTKPKIRNTVIPTNNLSGDEPVDENTQLDEDPNPFVEDISMEGGVPMEDVGDNEDLEDAGTNDDSETVIYLDELLRHDGLGMEEREILCPLCGVLDGVVKCRCCMSNRRLCAGCMVEQHQLLPFHNVKWTGSYFQKVSLQQLGLVVYLGHDGLACPMFGYTINDFIVVASNGIHCVSAKFCTCLLAPSHPVQLLRSQLVPATVHRPRTAFTFEVLTFFQLENLQGKLAAYDFCETLARISDNAGTLKIKDRRGHDPNGINATEPGQCAVECPACPQPGRNLPVGWEKADSSTRYILRCLATLSPNLCDSELHAVDHANVKFSSGYKSTGVGGTLCRHSLICKNGLGDLQKGERYANMDFIVFFSLIGYAFLPLMFSYDIVCQWWRNLTSRIKQLPVYMQISAVRLRSARAVIPKFHIYGHGKPCQLNYSLNLLPYSARTDGENPERWWAHINPISMSTKEMSPWSRRDTIDDHACSWNWRKITGLALEMQVKHQRLFEKLTATFDAELIVKWEALVTDWENNPRAPNPFEEKQSGATMADIRLELANEEAADAQKGIMSPHEMTASSWLLAGLELEEQQSLKAKPCGIGKRTSVGHRITVWREVQKLYMPGVVRRLRDGDDNGVSSNDNDLGSDSDRDIPSKPECTPLRLPSSISSSLWSAEFLEGLVQKERRLRLAQAHDALCELRQNLQMWSTLKHYKQTQIGGISQKANTRARALLTHFWEKVVPARSALVVLDPNGSWINQLLVLKDTDIKGPRRSDNDVGEGDRELSWIWLVPRTEMRDETGSIVEERELNEGLRVEWGQSRARAQRWHEEVQLLSEEMRRVVVFLDWKSKWWTVQGTKRSNMSADISSGLRAYAAKQENIYHDLAMSFGEKCFPVMSNE
ncbi:hypothetical protein BJ138DRAFT_1138468 [Hygrophoropsis aurantiaca]|uniref:Uncharacterized protein n=1 Tax=Hygrophoropsis aurantiaca TaxID=72124 RepID=A0ACB7ZWJ7_9AGAM|nr:hypothetical protein BJ138DRAFT_1138468 [Hygrophoropsis aurantiaca]